MSEIITIALDAMGGDDAPHIVVAGANIARRRHPDARFVLYGDEADLTARVAKQRGLSDFVEIRHAPEGVAADAKPSQVVRSGQETSMWRAIAAVKEGQADGVVSAGNTGALLAMAMLVLRRLQGIDRPAIASFFPTLRGETVMLDLGANIRCNERNLVEFAIMGEVFARISSHFALEEHEMREVEYDDYAVHKEDHEDLLDEIRDIMDAYEVGVFAAHRDAFGESLQQWFTNHFKTHDSRLHGVLGH